MGLPERTPELHKAEVVEMPLQRREAEMMEGALEIERQGDVFKALGWGLLAFDTIIVAFVWVGLRTGSDCWLIWTIVEAVLGLALIRMGIYWRDRASRMLK